jgi:predicted alpha/beta-hydrolase family hydrolase
MLFIQGSRDAFGTPGELEPVLARISPTPALHVVEGGDHSFKLSRKDPAAQVAAHEEIDRTIAAWITRSARASR